MISGNFYASKEWRRVRYLALMHYGSACMCCRSRESRLHVDHIKPISKYPELKLDITNLQILCSDCNLGKSNIDETDFRGKNKLVVQKVPPNFFCYIYISKNTCHAWDGKDTFCRMWSTGGLKKEAYKKNTKTPELPVCQICAKNMRLRK